jgi:hypothetical protein
VFDRLAELGIEPIVEPVEPEEANAAPVEEAGPPKSLIEELKEWAARSPSSGTSAASVAVEGESSPSEATESGPKKAKPRRRFGR